MPVGEERYPSASPHQRRPLLQVEIGGKIIDYGHKLASTYLRPLRVLGVRSVERWQ